MEQELEKTRKLTPGELEFHKRVTAAQQLARQMWKTVKPDITPEDLERFITTMGNNAGEIGWRWGYSTIAEDRPARGCVELEVQAHRGVDAIPTGDVTLTIFRVAYMDDDRSQAVGGPYWSQTIDKGENAKKVFQKAGEKLTSAWEEIKELTPRLPELARQRRAKIDRLFQEQGFKRTSYGWTREDSN